VCHSIDLAEQVIAKISERGTNELQITDLLDDVFVVVVLAEIVDAGCEMKYQAYKLNRKTR